MTKKQRIYLVNVGANVAHGRDARSPIFTAHRNSFEFVTFPDPSSLQQYPKSVHPFVRDSATLRTHLDPDWANLTYGDNCANGRAGALRQVEAGDILLFWALLWRIPGRTHQVFATSDRGWYLIGGPFATSSARVNRFLRCLPRPGNALLRTHTLALVASARPQADMIEFLWEPHGTRNFSKQRSI